MAASTSPPPVKTPDVAGESRPVTPVTSEQPSARLLSLSFLPPADVFKALATRPEGLNDAEVEARLGQFGPNKLTELPGPSLLGRLLQQFTHLFAVLLWAGSLLALVAGMPTLAAAIVAVIILNGIFGFVYEYRAEKAVAALKRLLPDESAVLRCGQERRVSAEDLVPGDVLILSEGDKVSADARLVSASDLRTDDSSLAGEGDLRRRGPRGAGPAAERVRPQVKAMLQTEVRVVIRKGTALGQGVTN